MRKFRLKYNLYVDENCDLKIQKGEDRQQIATHGTLFQFLSFNRRRYRLSAISKKLIIDVCYGDLNTWFEVLGEDDDKFE